MFARSLSLMWICLVAAAAPSLAQTRYELAAPDLDRRSQAILSEGELRIIDQAGRVTVYLRDPTADAAGGAFLAYRQSATGQVIRWPANGRGPMQLGTPRGGTIEFRPSRMQVIPSDDRPGGPAGDRALQRPVLPPATGAPPPPPRPAAVEEDLLGQVFQQRQAQPSTLRLGIRDERAQEWLLGHAGGRRLAMYPAGRTAEVDWFVVPAGRGYVRLQHLRGGEWLALGAGPGNTLTIDQVTQDARQLWRVVRTHGGTSGYWLESAFAPGLALSGTPGGTVGLSPVGSAPGQVWVPLPAPPTPAFQPLWRTVSHEVTPNPPLEPAQIDLINSHVMPIVILVGDRRTGEVRPVRIEPGGQVTYPFDRDAGASLVEIYETRSPGGVWNRQQLVTQIPAATIYDLSVYEEFVQSIAIDRTGTSPNPIEDISVLPKSVGMVLLPPGEGLPARGSFDAYAEAARAHNPGVVRRWDPKIFERPSAVPDPIQAALESVAPSRPPKPTSPPPAPAPTTNRQKF